MDEFDEEILVNPSFEDYEEPPALKPYEQVQTPPIAKLILDTVQDAPLALRDWAEYVVPKLLSTLSLHNAKGMGEVEAKRFLDKNNVRAKATVFKKLTEMPDQSLAVHTINATLGAWTVVSLANLSDFEQRLYLAGITLHDLNKMIGVTLRLQGKQKKAYEQAIKAWGKRLNVWRLIDEKHWEDVAFLAQNAEAVNAENRTLANYDNLETPPEELDQISDFVRLADLLASAAKHPDDVLYMKYRDKVAEIIRRVLRGNYVLRYHKTADNRGLITQLIHNAVLEQAQQQGWIPFLYFPDGVTYLAPKDTNELNLHIIPQQVRQRLVESVAGKLGKLVDRDGKGLKFSPEFMELLPLDKAISLAIQRLLEIIHDNKEVVTDKRKAKTKSKSKTLVEIDLEYPSSLNVDRLAEGIFGIIKLCMSYYSKGREDFENIAIHTLGMERHKETFNSINVNGGTAYNWYYIAGHFLKENSGIDTNKIEQILLQIFQNIQSGFEVPEKEPSFSFLEHYLEKILTIGNLKTNQEFRNELKLYCLTKKPRNSSSVCVICNGPSMVGAGHSTFSNKQKVGHSDSKPQICAICQAENMLQKFLMNSDLLSVDGTKYLHLYPTYYFTPITGKIMQRAYQEFKYTVFKDILLTYQQSGYELGSFIHSDIFQIREIKDVHFDLKLVKYSEGQINSYYLLGVTPIEWTRKKADDKPTETETWMMPALLSLISPLVLGTKVVVSDTNLPLYTSGADFPETVVLDGPHSFWQHGIKKTTFRLDELEKSLHATLALYGLVSEAYRDNKNYTIWNQLGSVARNLDSDALSVFGYADRISSQASKGKSTVTSTDGMAPWLAQRLMVYYKHITNYYEKYQLGGKNEMELIKETVEKYTVFYKAKGSKGRSPSAYSRLRPFNIAIDTILRLPTTDELDGKSLELQINGGLLAFLDRIRGGDTTITGFIPKGMSKNEVLYPVVVAFINHMVEEVLGRYCNNDRAVLRKRLNDLRNGCEAYYVLNVSKKDDSETEEMEMN